MSFVNDNLPRMEAELSARGIAILEAVPLDPQYFRWEQSNRRTVTNIALRRAIDTTLLVYVDDDVRYSIEDLPNSIFADTNNNGWRLLHIPADSSIFAVLNDVNTVLGLDGQRPQPISRHLQTPHVMAKQNDSSEPALTGDDKFNREVPAMPEPVAAPVVVEAEVQPGRAAARSYAIRFGKDLTALAKQGKIGPVIGRESELQAVVEILCKKGKNAPLLVGEPGVGKSAVAEAFALRVVAGAVPPILRDVQIVEINLGFLLAGASAHGELEERVSQILQEAQQRPDLILFLDELHIMNAPAMGGTVANMLKSELARGSFKLIGATTHRDYKQHIEADAALARRFQTVLVQEPTEDEALEILQGLRPSLEMHHNVVIPDEVLKEVVKLSAFYITDRQLPDKAIDLLDEACSRTALLINPEIQDESTPPDLDGAIESAIRGGDYARARELHDLRTR